jgi:hypothetical protein
MAQQIVVQNPFRKLCKVAKDGSVLVRKVAKEGTYFWGQ